MPRRPALLASLALVLAVLGGCTATVPGSGRVAARPASACPVAFLGVPGSGQGVHFARPGSAPRGVTRDDAHRFGGPVALIKTHLATIAGRDLVATAVDYPAVSVDDYASKDGLTARLGPSEAAGVRALRADLQRAWTAPCTDRPVLIAGYSQGAEVASRTVAALPATQRRHVALALLGNPSYRPGRPGDLPGRTAASGIRPNFQDGRAYQPPRDMWSRTVDVCDPADSVCNVRAHAFGWFGRLIYVYRHTAAHRTAYADVRKGYARYAATFLWWHRVLPQPKALPSPR